MRLAPVDDLNSRFFVEQESGSTDERVCGSELDQSRARVVGIELAIELCGELTGGIDRVDDCPGGGNASVNVNPQHSVHFVERRDRFVTGDRTVRNDLNDDAIDVSTVLRSLDSDVIVDAG